MNHKNVLKFICLILFSISVCDVNLNAQDLSQSEKNEILSKIPYLIRKNFVIPKIGEKTAKGIEKNFAKGKYDSISTYKDLAKIVTKDLQELSGDLHLYLRSTKTKNTKGRKMIRRAVSTSDTSRYERFRGKDGKLISWRMLEGNILYINVRVFAPFSLIKGEINDALKNSPKAKGFIVDLRTCPGGDASSMEYLAGSFIKNPTLLSKHTTRSTMFDSYSSKTPWGEINDEKPVIALTSKRSFSAAEAFSFFLQEIERISVIGEHTRGGGRTTRHYPLNKNLLISISNSIAVSSKGNQFQGKGVKPDISTSKEKALQAALNHIRREIG